MIKPNPRFDIFHKHDALTQLLHDYATSVLRKPFNMEARLQAGFDVEELEGLLDAAG